jgi:carbon-monoxide dehydrogenase iron sulfur subunit
MRRVYIKEEVCMGCHLCEVYCQLQHAPSRDLVKAFKKASSRPLPRLHVEEKCAVSFSVRCQNCDDAPCIQACLTGALTRDPVSLLVTLDDERCIGCGTCLLVCPLGAIKLDTGRGKALKCDLCQDEDIPACVANCPNEALVCVESQGEDSGIGKQVPVPIP